MIKKYLFMLSFLCLAFFYSTSAADLAPGLPISYATVGDYNMDGWLDIALTSEYGLILVYLGQSDGSFSGPIKSYCSGRPNVMDQADFNRDGRLDLVVGDTFYGKIRFMLNAGEGKFEINNQKTIWGVSPRNFIIFDFNADGKLDIAFADYYYNAISFLYGKDAMEFDGPISYPVPSPSAIAAADFDNDGLTDGVATSEGSNALYFFKQTEEGLEKKAQIQTGSRPVNMALADFNHDNILDVVVVNKNSNNISLYRGKLEDSDYSWQSPTIYSVGQSPSYASIADFNSDSYLDIAIACEGSNTVYFLLSTGLGNFTLSDETLATGSRPIQILAADFDNNGKSDLLTLNRGDQTVSIFKDEDISTKLSFNLPEVDIKIRKNGEGDPVDGPLSVPTNATDKIEIFGSLEANDCHGLEADVYLLLNAITPDLSGTEAVAEAKTYSITLDGITEGEAPFVEDLNITNIPEVPLWSFSTQDLAKEIGTGSYSIIGKLVIKGASGIVYYVSDAAEFGITGRIISNPPIVTVKANVGGGRVKAFADVEANDVVALMAFTYLWIDCSRTDTFDVNIGNETDPKWAELEETSVFTKWYSTTGWHSYHKYYYYDEVEGKIVEEEEGTEPDYIPPFSVWAVTDLTDYPLFNFPSSYFPYDDCTVHAGFIIEDWGGMDYSVFDDESF
ncbi:MAG: hypothetical protein AMJ45_00760 [Syntrophobacter sp. DG_60]|nr:MAG: hypothetical protein AMJ45_00760 [Syntrophobacter sp. DG_60]